MFPTPICTDHLELSCQISTYLSRSQQISQISSKTWRRKIWSCILFWASNIKKKNMIMHFILSVKHQTLIQKPWEIIYKTTFQYENTNKTKSNQSTWALTATIKRQERALVNKHISPLKKVLADLDNKQYMIFWKYASSHSICWNRPIDLVCSSNSIHSTNPTLSIHIVNSVLMMNAHHSTLKQWLSISVFTLFWNWH